MKAELPENEAERIRALEEAGLLDSAPDEEFDDLVRLASVVCETPIAWIALVDGHRHWLKASIGLDGQEVPRVAAFCDQSLLGKELTVVPDAWSDPRFVGNPLVAADPGIRFYAGAPLETEEGFRLGALCVIDRSPRELSTGQREALGMLARKANKHIGRLRQRALESAIAENPVDEELRASHGLFHAFMDNSPFLSFLKDADGKMVYYNRPCAQRFGIDRWTWLGKTDAELWPPQVATQLRANDLAVLRHWKMLVIDEQADPSAREQVIWRSYKFPFKDSAGREYVAGVAVDITADKEADLRLREYQRALEAANEKLAALSVTDGLTGLLNRRAFDEALDREYAIARRYGQPLSLIILDIDNFKALNDGFGHEEGDRVLRCVAAMMEKSFRSMDVVARYGGEEFAVLLPNTPRQAAAQTAERLRAAIEQLEADPHGIGVSIGLTTFDAAAAWTKEEFVRRTDDALYRAKREGKNRVCVS